MIKSEHTELTPRELATVLAALRYWQREGWRMAEGRELEIASDCGRLKPLGTKEIDDLCERINGGVR